MASIQLIDPIARSWYDRGVFVPFSTEELLPARMRVYDNGSREYIIPNITGCKGHYVMDWETICGMFPVSIYDRRLIELVDEHDVDTPVLMRAMMLKVRAEGYSGPREARLAKTMIDDDIQYQVLTTYAFIRHIVARDSADADMLFSSVHLRSEEAQRHVRMIMKRVSSKLGMHIDELYTRIDIMSALIAPIGLPWAGRPGRLRSCISDINQYALTVSQWAEMCPDELLSHVLFQRDASRLIVQLCTNAVSVLDGMIKNVLEVNSQLGDIENNVVALVQDISWLLDGWPAVISLHRDLTVDTTDDIADVVLRATPLIPRIPSVVTTAIADRSNVVGSGQVDRRVAPNSDWRTGLQVPTHPHNRTQHTQHNIQRSSKRTGAVRTRTKK